MEIRAAKREWGVERDGEKSRSLYKQSPKLLAATRPLLIDGDISTDTEPDFPPLLRVLQIHTPDKPDKFSSSCVHAKSRLGPIALSTEIKNTPSTFSECDYANLYWQPVIDCFGADRSLTEWISLPNTDFKYISRDVFEMRMIYFRVGIGSKYIHVEGLLDFLQNCLTTTP